MQEQFQSNNLKKEDNFDIRELTSRYFAQWKWFVFTVLLCLTFAYFNLRYSVPIYTATATILVKDDKKGGLQSELEAFSDMKMMAIKSNIDNEVEIIKSRTIIKKAIEKLNFNITYSAEGAIRTDRKSVV